MWGYFAVNLSQFWKEVNNSMMTELFIVVNCFLVLLFTQAFVLMWTIKRIQYTLVERRLILWGTFYSYPLLLRDTNFPSIELTGYRSHSIPVTITCSLWQTFGARYCQSAPGLFSPWLACWADVFCSGSNRNPRAAILDEESKKGLGRVKNVSAERTINSYLY